MRRLIEVGTAICAVVLLVAPADAASDDGARLVHAQYAGPPMDGGMGPDFGPGLGFGMGPGPFTGPAPYGGPGPYGGFRRSARRSTGPFRTYHGFRIDIGEAQGRIDVSSALAEVEHQIDIVDRSGVSPSLLARFRAVPIRIAVSFAGGGSHYNGGSEVSLGSLHPNDDRPVLLHEYMHVLEYRTFPGGFRNPTVRRFFDEALSQGLYPPDSYMMSNPAEFFAVTASCYLNGTVARDPYTRAAIRERQPDYYAYLSGLFGPRGDAVENAPPAAVVARGALAASR